MVELAQPKVAVLSQCTLRRVLILLLLGEVICQDDEFEWFRCDSCRATFFKVNSTLVGKLGHRSSLPSFEVIEVLEDVCENMFTKHEFGVKQHEGKKYLFGPGVIDHLGPNEGFGQMGMGDYDKRLAAYCRMFVEDVGEDKILSLFRESHVIDKEVLCKQECTTSASGTGATTVDGSAPRKKKPPKPKPPTPIAKPPSPPKKSSPPPSKPSSSASPKDAGSESSVGDNVLAFEGSLRLLPKLTVSQLRQLGEAVITELAARAQPKPVQTTTPSGARQGGEL